MPARSLLDGFDLIVVFFWAAASGAFDREDASNLVWPQMGASEVSLTNGALRSLISPFHSIFCSTCSICRGKICIFAVPLDY
jgi:nitrogen fixation-related uncharacterized protein